MSAANLYQKNPFWDFSLLVYGNRDVAQACLALQDRLGIDVNLVLFCCWCGRSGYDPVTSDQMETIRGRVKSFHKEVIKTARAIRLCLSDGYPHVAADLSTALRARILSFEIDCEHVEQDILYDLAKTMERPSGTSNVAAGIANLWTYFDSHGATLSTIDVNDVITIMAMCYPETEKSHIRDMLRDRNSVRTKTDDLRLPE